MDSDISSDSESPILKRKKNIRHPELYKRNYVKSSILNGKEYVNHKGNNVLPKEIGQPCKCRNDCYMKLTPENREHVFKRFYSFQSKNEQDIFLQGLIEAHEIKQRRPRKGEDARINSKHFKYHVMVGDLRQPVCLNTFLSLHAISRKKVERLRGLLLLGQTPADKRGRHPASNSISSETKQLIIKHIQSYPVKESHYGSNTKKYLDERLDIKLIHSMFLKKHPNLKVGYDFFRMFFNDNFDLSFGRPQVDSCCTCEELTVKLKNAHLNDAAKRVAEGELAVHKRRAKSFYTILNAETKDDDNGVLSLCIDYMMNISLPSIPVQEIFYLRQLTVNVFCIHDLKKDTASFYIYHQGEAKKGPDEVCTFLYDYLRDKFGKFTELHLFSDNCCAQNKNHALSRFLLALTDLEIFKKVESYYPVRGHSYLPCDRDFSMVKRVLRKNDRFYSLDDISRMILSSSGKNKFQVKQIEGSEIIDFKSWWRPFYKTKCISLETAGRRTPKDKKVAFNISKFKHFSYNSDKKGLIVAREYINGLVSHTFPLRNNSIPTQLPEKNAYSRKNPIHQAKLNDIRKCMAYIPAEHKEFYSAILEWPVGNENNTDDDE